MARDGYGYRDLESGRGGVLPVSSAGGDQLVHLALAKDRRNFVRKVFGTVAVQLAVTAVLAAPIASATDDWLQAHAALFLGSTLGLLALSLLLCCGGAQLMRRHPWNLFILAAFTMLESVSVGFVCAAYELQSVLICLAASAAVAGALTLFAARTKVDVTRFGGYLRALSLGLFVFGLLGLYARIPALQLLYAGGGALLFSGYIVYDVQLVLGGKHQNSRKFSLDDSAFAALSIYLDLVRLFLFLLRVFGERRQRRR